MYTPAQLAFLIFLIALLVTVIQVGILSIAFEKLGLSHETGLMIIVLSFAGSMINLPLFKVKANDATPMKLPFYLRSLLKHPPKPFEGYTQIYVNVGGCLIPLVVSLYIFRFTQFDIFSVVIATLLMTSVSYFFSRPIPGLGIGMPIFIAPLAAAIIAIAIAPEYSAPVAYISGTLGVLIGADLLRIKDIKHLGSPVASIGGAGTFDGIFITGIVAALLT